MKKYILAAALGGAILASAPAFATQTNYSFNTTTCGTGAPTACADNIGPYAVTNNGVTATAVGVYYTVGGTSTGFNSAANLTGGYLGVYSGNGLGGCEATSGVDCTTPNHQIDNGKNGGTNYDYEFVLFKFSAAVDLSSIQLGNYGNSGGTADPFNITYFTSTAAVNSLGSLAGTTLGSGFTAGTATQSSTGGSSCVLNSTDCVETLSGSATDNVTYLLIGASTLDKGTDFFKIQDIAAFNTTSGSSSSSTPEPATFGMIGLALAGLGIYGRKRKSGNS